MKPPACPRPGDQMWLGKYAEVPLYRTAPAVTNDDPQYDPPVLQHLNLSFTSSKDGPRRRPGYEHEPMGPSIVQLGAKVQRRSAGAIAAVDGGLRIGRLFDR
jgi:hypothetical protein